MKTEARTKKIEEVITNKQPDLSVVLENIHDPHNASAILRTCDAVGIADIHLLYTKETFPIINSKSSASANKWINIIQYNNIENLKNNILKEENNIYATCIDKNAISIFDIDWTQPSTIIVGNENRGVSNQIMKICNKKIFIPMNGMVQSLNVSVATAIILYEALRQRNLKNMYPNKKLSEKWIKKQVNEWIKK